MPSFASSSARSCWSNGVIIIQILFIYLIKDKAVQPANVNSINYIVGFHDIKAGDMFVPDVALEELFGFVSRQCKVIYEGRELDSLRKLNDKFWDYDKWEIFDLFHTRIKIE